MSLQYWNVYLHSQNVIITFVTSLNLSWNIFHCKVITIIIVIDLLFGQAINNRISVHTSHLFSAAWNKTVCWLTKKMNRLRKRDALDLLSLWYKILIRMTNSAAYFILDTHTPSRLTASGVLSPSSHVSINTQSTVKIF